MRYSYKKIYAWNPNLAYLAGIIASDGCLSKNGRHLNVTSTDIEILDTVKLILDSNVKIGVKRNGFGGFGSYIQFSDVALYDFLQTAGITPAKSKTILRVDVPDEFYADFLRGFFDGDGIVYGYWDKRWRSSLMYYTQFTSASLPYVEWLQLRNIELIGVSSGKIKRGSRAYKLSYAKLDSRKLFDYMYYGQGLPALARKHDKFVNFLKSDPYA